MDDNVTLSDGVMHSLIPQDYGIELSKSAGGQRKSIKLLRRNSIDGNDGV